LILRKLIGFTKHVNWNVSGRITLKKVNATLIPLCSGACTKVGVDFVLSLRVPKNNQRYANLSWGQLAEFYNGLNSLFKIYFFTFCKF